MAVQLLITDKNLDVQGDPLDGWTNLDATKKFNEPGSGSVDLPARPDVMAQLQPGNRLVLIRDGAVWMAGPLEIPADFSWSVTESPGSGRVTVSFSDDLAIVAGYITWPTPANAWTAQLANTYRQIASTNAETIIRALVNENCGPGARAERRIANFALDSVAGVGTSTTVKTRFEALLDTCRRIAVDGGAIGFRTRQSATQILFGCYQPRDLTATARFSIGLGNLRSIQVKQSAPDVTHALIAGTEPETGTTGRVYVQAADAAAAASWWRVEKYVDGSAENDTNGELTQAGKEEIAGGAAPVELATVTVDTEDLKAGRDFDLGDRVTVALPYGVEIANLVRSIHLQATPNSGEYVTTLIGSPEATTDPAMVKALRTLGRRLGRLETR
ncbi:siphovirus ReqiPepy6 Gp37-like family protein [Streptomyces sp. NBC_00654]|uniref:siphovirus ReqiPepy6 Gp37-like family protein n=1 Tax=Streptomyces sp. NBC_00654 TaxID=2975799 RepID=UPI0022562BD5|nr:siphovirus ReqiPepy6 Gp37-like family protein [Streptomyces sp. NBC_00654]MCX4969386.1 siphovirus ReqiPepy6 Gp37-like family protein [Streptomyces sp. NBC_00654]MCX4971186.1 siphovirus ReqiPepy6 Gp37-like family protein [Streptomyces sp. NBC_00654]